MNTMLTPELGAAIAPLLRAPGPARSKLRRWLRDLRSAGRNHRIDYLINERAGWKAAIDASTVDGRVGVVVAGMDCDCSQYHRESVIDAPRSVVAWLHEYRRHCEWLDGPESTSFVKPTEVEDGYSRSRDLALEAFEDGRPAFIRAAEDLDEEDYS